ncbi:MAG: bifunctional UDP-N-acetylglucosamine diphosphorylase/glucosamine-1-phosphate N-acetyltransferase GlmU [Holosporaceae bacterium]|nr:bifunctional UDP-N-acetylglucosamine diphosphorylase/glucosamine-1-phosphate N-acetyltransferase GlmU [Holosporaceae bacterium]
MVINSVIILAAGNGSRLQSDLPKVFHRIGGLTLLDHVVKAAQEINPQEIIAVLNQKFSQMKLVYEANVKVACQETPEGTAHAVKCGMEVLSTTLRPSSNNDDEWVYILYGDIPLISGMTLRKLGKSAQKCRQTAVVVLAMQGDSANELGKLEPTDEAGMIKSIIESKDASSEKKTAFLPLCNAGLLIKRNVLEELIGQIKASPTTGEFYITEIVRLAYQAGHVCRYFEGDTKELLGINTRAELALAEKLFQEREREKHMNNGVTLLAPETVFFSHDTRLEHDVVVHPYVVFLEGVRVESGAQIGPFCMVEGAIIGKNVCVGPFSRLRGKTEILDEARVGNFVEIKNSIVGEGAKVSHLSYIGDTIIGEMTNIGAGTITCNYDGEKKHRTVIGKNAFIGSNSALVAPVEIGDTATVGAGSVIVKNVERGALALARSRQRNIVAWNVIRGRKRKKCAVS